MPRLTKAEKTSQDFWELWNSGKLHEAESLLNAAIQKTRNTNAKAFLLHAKAMARLDQGRPDAALQLLLEAERVDPKSPSWPLAAADVMTAYLGQLSQATVKARLAIKVERSLIGRRGPAFHHACGVLGEIAVRRGNYHQAGIELLRSLDVQDWQYLSATGPDLALVTNLVSSKRQIRASRRYLREARSLAERGELRQVMLKEIDSLEKRLKTTRRPASTQRRRGAGPSPDRRSR